VQFGANQYHALEIATRREAGEATKASACCARVAARRHDAQAWGWARQLIGDPGASALEYPERSVLRKRSTRRGMHKQRADRRRPGRTSPCLWLTGRLRSDPTREEAARPGYRRGSKDTYSKGRGYSKTWRVIYAAQGHYREALGRYERSVTLKEAGTDARRRPVT